MKRLILIASIILPLLTACEKVIDFDITDTQPVPVVNALPCTDSLVFVNITYSRFFLDNRPFDAVDGVTLTLDVNGATFTPTGRDGANHFFDYRAAAGDTLTLHVAVPGFGDVTGGTRVPMLPDIAVPQAEIDTLQPLNSGDITFTINDPEGTNYYCVYISERDSGIRWNAWDKKWDTVDTVITPYFTCLNKEITSPEVNVAEELIMDYYNMLLFSDLNIDGRSYEAKLSVLMLKDTAEHPMLRQYTLIVESLSREAFMYAKDVAAAGSMSSLFAEPTQVFSNLSNGLGIFAGKARRVFPLDFIYKETASEQTKRTRQR